MKEKEEKEKEKLNVELSIEEEKQLKKNESMKEKKQLKKNEECGVPLFRIYSQKKIKSLNNVAPGTKLKIAAIDYDYKCKGGKYLFQTVDGELYKGNYWSTEIEQDWISKKKQFNFLVCDDKYTKTRNKNKFVKIL